MKLQSIKKGFTLIELLVVITIIGILATGATTVFTSQIQKSRDSVRITDMKAIKSAIEQVYQDNTEYPKARQFLSGSTDVTAIKTYMEKVPADKKHGQSCNNGWDADEATNCAYLYKTQPDSNWIDFWAYEITVAFESDGNVKKKAGADGGNDDRRLEEGTLIGSVEARDEKAWDDVKKKEWACALAGSTPTSDTQVIYINGDGNCT